MRTLSALPTEDLHKQARPRFSAGFNDVADECVSKRTAALRPQGQVFLRLEINDPEDRHHVLADLK